MATLNHKPAAAVIIVLGGILRLLLWWGNPPSNAFDNHFEPIALIMQNDAIPAKDACEQCFHPPVFYWISAMVGNEATDLGFRGKSLLKLLQLMPCLYGILNLILIHQILLKLPFTEFAHLTALATICFLPRHIFMSAMHSNDTISYLCVALSIYLLFLAIEKKLAVWPVAAAGLATTITLFTKYTAFAILPAFFVVFAMMFWKRIAPWSSIVRSFGLVVVLPTLVLSLSFIANFERYGTVLPSNLKRLDPSAEPRDSAHLDYFSFKPWESIQSPIVTPGKMHSYWTMVYNGMWFDNEPKFLYFVDPDVDWWHHYYGWLKGKESFPGENPSTGHGIWALGSALIALGLVPLLLTAYGVCLYLRGTWKSWDTWGDSDHEKLIAVKLSVFPPLLLANAAGIIAISLRTPYFNAAKASYFLNSLPVLAVFLALGTMPLAVHRAGKWMIGVACGLVCGLASALILQIVYALLTAQNVSG
jgi:4-amino-4-deoxy-L-arabinose transferase-like glycosyltransferase